MGINTMKQYSFEDKMAFSKGISRRTALSTIVAIIPGCISVEPASLKDDLRGIDFMAVLSSGVVLKIDQKAREPGCSRYWKGEPEIALELWSKLPERDSQGKPGWTWDESKDTDYTLHTFDSTDTNVVYLLPFQLLRKAFWLHGKKWKTRYGTSQQNSGQWRSECMFVPAGVVLAAITEQMTAIAH